MEVRPLTAADIEDVSRLHRFSSTAGSSVLGARDLTEVLAAAAEQSEGVFGFVALLTDAEEPDEPEVVGALTAQWDSGTDTSSSDHSSSGSSDPSSSGARQQEQLTGAASGSKLGVGGGQEVSCVGGQQVVLLTLVVRADARRQGVGTALLAVLTQHIQQQSCLQQQQPQQQQQQPIQAAGRIVADVALANADAWDFFKQAGFRQGPSCGPTAEAVLDLGVQQQGPARIPTADGDGNDAARNTATAAALPANMQGSLWLAAPARRLIRPRMQPAVGTSRMVHPPKRCSQLLRAQHRPNWRAAYHGGFAVCI